MFSLQKNRIYFPIYSEKIRNMWLGFLFVFLFPSALSFSSLTLHKSLPLTSLHHSSSFQPLLSSSSPNFTPSTPDNSPLASSSEQDSLQWILSQKADLIQHQNNITRFLQSKNIHLSDNEISDASSGLTNLKRKTLVVESTPQMPYFCRLSLCNAEPHDKLIAPCGCTGSQQVRSPASPPPPPPDASYQ
jgi:hypothetical protein